MKDHPLKLAKIVVFPRTDTIEGTPVHKYVIMGMVVTDEPIKGMPEDQGLIAGADYPVESLLAALSMMKIGKPEACGKSQLGDATSVILSLQDIVFASEETQL